MGTTKILKSLTNYLKPFKCARTNCTRRVKTEGWLCNWHHHNPNGVSLVGERGRKLRGLMAAYKDYEKKPKSMSIKNSRGQWKKKKLDR